MPTATKVMFRLETLKEQALAAVDEQISAAYDHLQSLTDPLGEISVRSEWRSRQFARIHDLLNAQNPSDEQLASFRVEPMPEPDWRAVREARRELQHLESKRRYIQVKSASLVADDEGNIALTKNQLREFFGLE